MNASEQPPAILLTGATGCIGRRLLVALEAHGRPVRCMTRRPAALDGRVGSHTSVVRGDCLDPTSLPGALAGIDTAFYLVHSMGGTADFEAQDRVAARNFATAARAAGVRRLVYVGGLGSAAGLSRHLRSRHETGAVLHESGVPVVELRSGIVIGAGSLSFELIRALVERLPVMICPSWVRTSTQPIALADLPVAPAAAFAPIRRIGGDNGWYYGDWIWRLRGIVDRLIGGVGMNRGRRDGERLAVGDVLDCWRVEVCEPDACLRLAAEMKVPGRAWLQFDVTARGAGASTIRQTAIFDAAGLFGRIYWHALYPIHVLLFEGLLRSIARRAVRAVPADTAPCP